MQEELFKFCNEKLGFTNRVGNALYGRAGIYNASVFVAADYFNINISYFLDDTQDEKLHALEDKLKFDPSIISLGGNGTANFTSIRIKLPLNDQSISKIESIISDYVNYLKSYNFPAVKGKVRVADATSLAAESLMRYHGTHNAFPRSFSGSPANPIVVDVKNSESNPSPVVIDLKKATDLKKQAASQNFGLGSVLRGIAGAFLGASLFSIPHLILLALLLDNLIYDSDYDLGYMFFFATIFISVGARLGYSLFNGDRRRAVKYSIMISVVSIVTIVATMLGSGLITASYAMHVSELFDSAATDPHTIILLIFSLIANIGFSISYLRKDKEII